MADKTSNQIESINCEIISAGGEEIKFAVLTENNIRQTFFKTSKATLPSTDKQIETSKMNLATGLIFHFVSNVHYSVTNWENEEQKVALSQPTTSPERNDSRLSNRQWIIAGSSVGAVILLIGFGIWLCTRGRCCRAKDKNQNYYGQNDLPSE